MLIALLRGRQGRLSAYQPINLTSKGVHKLNLLLRGSAPYAHTPSVKLQYYIELYLGVIIN